MPKKLLLNYGKRTKREGGHTKQSKAPRLRVNRVPHRDSTLATEHIRCADRTGEHPQSIQPYNTHRLIFKNNISGFFFPINKQDTQEKPLQSSLKVK